MAKFLLSRISIFQLVVLFILVALLFLLSASRTALADICLSMVVMALLADVSVLFFPAAPKYHETKHKLAFISD